MSLLHAFVIAEDGHYRVAWSDGRTVMQLEPEVFKTPLAAVRCADRLDPLPVTRPASRPAQETPTPALGAVEEVTSEQTERPVVGRPAEEIAGAAALTASTSVSSASRPTRGEQIGLSL